MLSSKLFKNLYPVILDYRKKSVGTLVEYRNLFSLCHVSQEQLKLLSCILDLK